MNLFKKADRDRSDAEDELAREVRYAAAFHGVPARELADVVLDRDEDDEEGDVEKERRGRRIGLWVTLVFVGAAFGLGIVGLMKLSSMADKTGPSAVAGIQQMNASIAPVAANQTLSGIHIWFQYPAVFDEVTHPTNWGNTSERYELASDSDYHETIQVYVENAPQLAYDSGYLWRSQHPELYTPNPVKIRGEAAVVMVKTDLSERTLYWPHAGHIVIMSATGIGNKLGSYMDVITSSLRWQ